MRDSKLKLLVYAPRVQLEVRDQRKEWIKKVLNLSCFFFPATRKKVSQEENENIYGTTP